MKDPADNRRIAFVMAFLLLGWMLFFQPLPGWSGAIQISSVRVAFSLHSDTVRFRTLVSGSGQSGLVAAFGAPAR